MIKFLEQPFLPVLFGNDINAYSMARAFHEAYGVKSVVVGKSARGPNADSLIVDFRLEKDLEEEETFKRTVASLSQEFQDRAVILLGCGDSYIELLAKNRDNFPGHTITPYINYQKMRTLINKENFYQICDRFDLPHPSTFIYRREMGKDVSLPFGYPVIVKPADQIAYWKNPFPGQKKVYKARKSRELFRITSLIYASGYRDNLVIQDFVPGDDTFMRVLTCYSSQSGEVKLAALGHVLLEEHTPHGIGNHAVIINEENETLVEKVRKFLDGIGYIGFSNLDIKYDVRDKTYKFLELNARQGRSNYYVTGAGENLAKYLVEDRVFKKKVDFKSVKNAVLWLVVPQSVAFSYVKDPNLREQMRALIKAGRIVNPLFYPGDLGLKRRLRLLKTHLSHFFKFARYYR